jgi:hypothetical protein
MNRHVQPPLPTNIGSGPSLRLTRRHSMPFRHNREIAERQPYIIAGERTGDQAA